MDQEEGARLSIADDLLKTRQNELKASAKAKIPKSWRAGERANGDGTIDRTSDVYDDANVPRTQLLIDHGYDPEKYVIVGAVGHSSWTAYLPKEYRTLSDPKGDVEDAFTFTAHAFKFKVVERSLGNTPADIDELVKGLDSREPYQPPFKITMPGGAWIFAIGDMQFGKLESPLEETAERFVRYVDEAALHIGKASHVHIALLGDCIEGMNSQGGKLRWRTSLTLTEQVRVVRRLVMYAVEAFAPMCDRLTIASIPGNHDEAGSRDLHTRSDDSWAIEAVVAVEDAISMSKRQDLKHVEIYVPGPDQHGVVMEVGGMRVAHIHGHQHPMGKHWAWMSGQSLGRQPEGEADLLLEGHWHHFQHDEEGHREYVGVPAVETESVWWKHKKGTPGNPGALILRIKDGKLASTHRLR
jgi:hypothetical protein